MENRSGPNLLSWMASGSRLARVLDLLGLSRPNCVPGRCTTGPTRRWLHHHHGGLPHLLPRSPAKGLPQPERPHGNSPRPQPSAWWYCAPLPVPRNLRRFHTPIKKRLLACFLALGVASVAAMFFITREIGSRLRALHAGEHRRQRQLRVLRRASAPRRPRDEIDRVSTAGYALGYLGGGRCSPQLRLAPSKPAWFGLPAGPNLSEHRRPPVAPGLPLGGRLVAGLLDSAVPTRRRAQPVQEVAPILHGVKPVFERTLLRADGDGAKSARTARVSSCSSPS